MSKGSFSMFPYVAAIRRVNMPRDDRNCEIALSRGALQVHGTAYLLKIIHGLDARSDTMLRRDAPRRREVSGGRPGLLDVVHVPQFKYTHDYMLYTHTRMRKP